MEEKKMCKEIVGPNALRAEGPCKRRAKPGFEYCTFHLIRNGIEFKKPEVKEVPLPRRIIR